MEVEKEPFSSSRLPPVSSSTFPLGEVDTSMLKLVAQAHIDSFNYAVEEGLRTVCSNLNPVEIYTDTITNAKLKPFKHCSIWFEDFEIW
jgi:hypothetical protein